MKTYTALTPIEYNGKPYAVGDAIDIDDKDVQQLIDVNAVVLSRPTLSGDDNDKAVLTPAKKATAKKADKPSK